MNRVSHGWAVASLEARITAHVHAWEKARTYGQPLAPELFPFVTISREYGCEGLALSLRLQDILNERCRPFFAWVAYDQALLTKVASGYWHVFDPQCGFTAITAPTLARLKLDGLARDFFFENDMLIRLNVVDARVIDVSTATLYGDERSSLRIGHSTWTFPLRLLRGFAWRFVKRHVVNDFGPIALLALLGGLLLVFGVVFGAYHWVESALTAKAASAGTVMIAVVPIVLGSQLLLQALVLEVQSSAGASETREYARQGVERRASPECSQ